MTAAGRHPCSRLPPRVFHERFVVDGSDGPAALGRRASGVDRLAGADQSESGAPPAPPFSGTALWTAAQRCREIAYIVSNGGPLGVALGAEGERALATGSYALHGALPGIFPDALGDERFRAVHDTRFAYVTGSMANGIATSRLVASAARAGCLAFFGAAGLLPAQVEAAVVDLGEALGPRAPWGCNLIHSPSEPHLEDAVVDVCLRHGVTKVEASAFMKITPAIVRYACSGLTRDRQGGISRANHIIAKVSRPEIARHFVEPAPSDVLDHLARQGLLSSDESALAARVPLAEDVTVEADSGGHTDRRPLGALFPVIVDTCRRLAERRGWPPPRVGAAGGIGSPVSVASAFALGAAYVVTGSINQSCVESGLSSDGCAMLAQAGVADVIMAPAADMFELGIDVQVLRRGTMFGPRGRRLYDLYRTIGSLDELSETDRSWLEGSILGTTIEEAWTETKAYWTARDPGQFQRAESDRHQQVALLFRSYLGLASRWAIEGRTDRRADYQIWCSSAMGAFNAWVAGSFLEAPERRTVDQVARNLLEGAAVVTRAHQLRSAGVGVPDEAFDFRPRILVDVDEEARAL